MVTVAPAIASGRLMESSAFSPGHGCQVGISSGFAGSNVGASPEMPRFQTGEATRRHRSTQLSLAFATQSDLVHRGEFTFPNELRIACPEAHLDEAIPYDDVVREDLLAGEQWDT